MKSKLALGTAQLGMNYGITNKRGIIEIGDAKDMLEKAIEKGIKTLDTAQEYGISEKIIGKSNVKDNFEIITKMRIEKGESQKEWTTKCKKSRDNMKIDSIDTLLIHNPENVTWELSCMLTEWAYKMKQRDIVKFGISIYKEEDLKNVNLESIDVVQLPLSIYNQEHVNNGLIPRLKKLGIEVQARSCFMQGLILTGHEDWPKNISRDLKIHHKRWESHLDKYKMTKMDGALQYCKQSKADIILVGATSCKEIEEIADSWNSEYRNKMEIENWAWNSKEDIDPRNWTEKKIK